MPLVSCIVQVTADSVRSICIPVIFKIDADAVGFLVAEQFTGGHIRDLDCFYFVVLESFVSKEENIWKH